MYYIDIERQKHPNLNTTEEPSIRFHGDVDCDFCGRAVRRETAFERIQTTDDGDEVIVLCAGCEFGSD
jgi:hypothetical protein